MIQRIAYLILIRQKAAVRRFRYDFARELAAFLSALVLVALFAHIFHDFLTAKVADLPAPLLTRVKAVVTLAVGFTAALALRRTVLQERSREGMVSCARRRGENNVVLRIYQVVFYGIVSVFTIAMWGAFVKWIAFFPSPTAMLLATTALIAFAFRPRTATTREETTMRWSAVAARFSSRTQALLRWRLVQMATRLPAARNAIICGSLGYVVVPLLAFQEAPLPLAAMVALAAGIFVAAAFCIQLASDVKQAWAEQSMGVTHQEIVAVYRRLAWGAVVIILPLTFGAGWMLDGLKGGFTLASLGATGPLLAPSLMFQLDARRPLLQILVILLAALFLGTTMLMHPAGVILLALVIQTAGNYQRDLYYRAKA